MFHNRHVRGRLKSLLLQMLDRTITINLLGWLGSYSEHVQGSGTSAFIRALTWQRLCACRCCPWVGVVDAYDGTYQGSSPGCDIKLAKQFWWIHSAPGGGS